MCCLPRSWLESVEANRHAASTHSAFVSKLSSTRRMGGYGAPPRVGSNRPSSISMPVTWTATPPRRCLICRSRSHRPIIAIPESVQRNISSRTIFIFSSRPRGREVVPVGATPTMYHEVVLRDTRAEIRVAPSNNEPHALEKSVPRNG
jgi:hypothetical protein